MLNKRTTRVAQVAAEEEEKWELSAKIYLWIPRIFFFLEFIMVQVSFEINVATLLG